MLYFYISLYYVTLQVKSKQMISDTLRQTTGHLWKLATDNLEVDSGKKKLLLYSHLTNHKEAR